MTTRTMTIPAHGTPTLRLFRRAAVAAAVALGGLLAAADPASATGPKATLRMKPGSFSCFTMSGHIPMGQYETHGYLNNGAHLGVRAYGDDPLVDDFLGKVTGVTKASGIVEGAAIYPTAEGIGFEWVTCGPRQFWLDEDTPDSDEVYVQVTVTDGDGGILANVETNRVTGKFGFNQ